MWISRFLKGTVRFVAIGQPKARLLNLCARKQYPLWKVEEQNGLLFADTSVWAYRKMAREIRRENRRPLLKEKNSQKENPQPLPVPSGPWWAELESQQAAASQKPLTARQQKRKDKWEKRKKELLRFAGISDQTSPAKAQGPAQTPSFSSQSARMLMEHPDFIRRPEEKKKKPPKKKRSALHLSRPWKRKKRAPRDYIAIEQAMARQARAREKQTLTLQVVQRQGIRFFLHRYRHRKGMALGLACSVLFLFAMQNFIWDIQVHGNQTVSDQAILETLKELNLDIGTPKNRIKSNQLAQRLVLRHPEMAWAAVNVLDCRVVIELQERVYPPEPVEKDQPTNVIAQEEGVILSTHVKGGKAVVKKGDGVAKGDLLITGLLEDSYGRMVVRHGWGEVIAQVEQTVMIEIPLEQTLWKPAKASVCSRWLKVLGLRLPLSPPFWPWEGAVSEAQTQKPVMLGELELPLTLYETTVTPLVPETIRLTEQQAREQAEAEMEKQLVRQFAGSEILSTIQVGYVQNNSFILECRVTCQRDIGLEQPFSLEEATQQNTEEQEPEE